jgi:quinol monooxygenase YgiN
VTKYSVCIPRAAKPGDTNIYILEEYASQAVFEQHCKNPIISKLVELIMTPGVLASPIISTYTDIVASLSRPAGGLVNDEFVVWAELNYKEETIAEAEEGWTKVVKATEANEPQVGMYYCLRERERPTTVRMMEAYESEDFFWNVHCKSDVVVKRMEDEERLRVGEVDVVFLKAVAGYLRR